MNLYAICCAVPAAGALVSAAMPAPANVYAMPPAQAYAKLYAMPIAAQAAALTDTSGVRFAIAGEPGRSVTWKVSAQGYFLGEIRADITAEGAARSRVDVRLRVADGVGKQLMAKEIGGDADRQAFVTDIATLVAAEVVDAALEDRPPDIERVRPAVLSYVAAHSETLRKFGITAEQFSRSNKSGDAGPTWGKRAATGGPSREDASAMAAQAGAAMREVDTGDLRDRADALAAAPGSASAASNAAAEAAGSSRATTASTAPMMDLSGYN